MKETTHVLRIQRGLFIKFSLLSLLVFGIAFAREASHLFF